MNLSLAQRADIWSPMGSQLTEKLQTLENLMKSSDIY